ncbi:MAG: SlyX family protein [Myxococcaceae bacterium]
MSEARIVELELRFMEQQQLLQSLSDVVYAQSQALDRVRAEVDMLKKKLDEPGLVDANQKERPPHY